MRALGLTGRTLVRHELVKHISLVIGTFFFTTRFCPAHYTIPELLSKTMKPF